MRMHHDEACPEASTDDHRSLLGVRAAVIGCILVWVAMGAAIFLLASA